MKTRFFQAEMKEIELKEGSIKIKGFASTPDIDRYNDIVAPKAFKGAIDGYMENPVILLQHNSDKPIGKTVDYKVTGKGLNITVELTNDIDNVFKNIQDGILKGFSIGFIPKKWEYKMVGNVEVREITELDLIEVSVVSTPANASSLFTLSKSIKSFFEEIKEDNYINNQTIMDKKETEVVEETTNEEVVEQVNEETTEKEVDEIVEGTNVTAPDEVENVDENSTDETETDEEETTENVEETETEEVENDEAGKVEELEKSIEAMKKELQEQKEFTGNLLDIMIKMSDDVQETKGVVNSIPMKKGLATLGAEQKKLDPLAKALFDAKAKY